MTLQEIIDGCRDQARDDGANDVDRLWNDEEMVRYINRIQRRIARETLCLKDATTAAVCVLTLTPVDYTTYVSGTLDYIWANDSASPLYQKDVTPYLVDLHDSILEIEEVKSLTFTNRLRKVSSQKWRNHLQWEQFITQPTEYATDLAHKKIAFKGRSLTVQEMQMTVKRLPLVDLDIATPTGVPEIPVNYHDFFHNGVMERMYRKQDAETLDKAKADEYKELFLDDLDEIKRQERIILNDYIAVNNSLSAFR